MNIHYLFSGVQHLYGWAPSLFTAV